MSNATDDASDRGPGDAEAFLEAARQGRPALSGRLYERLRGIALKLGRSFKKCDAEEIADATLEALLRKPPLEGVGSAEAVLVKWVTTTARRRFLDATERAAREVPPETEGAEAAPGAGETGSQGAAEVPTRDADRLDVLNCVDKVRAVLRAEYPLSVPVFDLQREEYLPAEITQIVGISSANYHQIAGRMRKMIAKHAHRLQECLELFRGGR